jgi:hypothetical protein
LAVGATWLLAVSVVVLTQVACGGGHAAVTGEPRSPWPIAKITNGLVTLTLYLPDAREGYYRGTRFDWSGLIAQAEYEGHTFFSEWQTPHDPEIHDHVIGPAEEFGMTEPLGYEEAAVGESFIKIGVGHLEKKEEEKYSFWEAHRIVKPGTWEIARGEDWIEFRQDLADERGWGYRYIKRISLAENVPVFTISHRLKNIGTRPIKTDHYCHNFLLIDHDPIGTHYRVRLTFEAPEEKALEDIAVVRGNEIVFEKDIPKDQALWAQLEGLRGVVEDYQATIENTETGAGIRIQGDRAPVKFNFWSVSSAICPEPFVEFELAAGEEARWASRYTCFVLEGGAGPAQE